MQLTVHECIEELQRQLSNRTAPLLQSVPVTSETATQVQHMTDVPLQQAQMLKMETALLRTEAQCVMHAHCAATTDVINAKIVDR